MGATAIFDYFHFVADHSLHVQYYSTRTSYGYTVVYCAKPVLSFDEDGKILENEFTKARFVHPVALLPACLE